MRHEVRHQQLDMDYKEALALEPISPGADAILATKMSKNLPLRDLYAEEGIRHLKALEMSLRGAPTDAGGGKTRAQASR